MNTLALRRWSDTARDRVTERERPIINKTAINVMKTSLVLRFLGDDQADVFIKQTNKNNNIYMCAYRHGGLVVKASAS